MSSRGAITDRNSIADVFFYYKSPYSSTLGRVTWGSAGKQPCSYGRFREIATSNESHVFLAILATLLFPQRQGKAYMRGRSPQNSGSAEDINTKWCDVSVCKIKYSLRKIVHCNDVFPIFPFVFRKICPFFGKLSHICGYFVDLRCVKYYNVQCKSP